MKTEQDLKKMMKSKKYSGPIDERDPAFIKEVEDGFAALHSAPGTFKLGIDETKVSESIRLERDNRLKQLFALRDAVTETQASIAKAVLLTEKIEMVGNLAEIRKHFLELEASATLIAILNDRKDKVSKQSAAANEAFAKALADTHFCAGCKNLRQDRMGLLCFLDRGGAAIPLEDLKSCPDPSGKDFDDGRPFIHRGAKVLPGQGVD